MDLRPSRHTIHADNSGTDELKLDAPLEQHFLQWQAVGKLVTILPSTLRDRITDAVNSQRLGGGFVLESGGGGSHEGREAGGGKSIFELLLSPHFEIAGISGETSISR